MLIFRHKLTAAFLSMITVGMIDDRHLGWVGGHCFWVVA